MSDNASAYRSAATELHDPFISKTLATSLERQGVEWKFITKKAFWLGGYWERLIGVTKSCLNKILQLGRAYISLTTLQTMVIEIEAVLNNRPLTCF